MNSAKGANPANSPDSPTTLVSHHRPRTVVAVMLLKTIGRHRWGILGVTRSRQTKKRATSEWLISPWRGRPDANVAGWAAPLARDAPRWVIQWAWDLRSDSTRSALRHVGEPDLGPGRGPRETWSEVGRHVIGSLAQVSPPARRGHLVEFTSSGHVPDLLLDVGAEAIAPLCLVSTSASPAPRGRGCDAIGQG